MIYLLGHMRCLIAGIIGAALWSPLPANGNPMQTRFLIVSSTKLHSIFYSELPGLNDLVKPRDQQTEMMPRLLIDGQASKCTGTSCTEDSDQGLSEPHSVVAHGGSEEGMLYVADGIAIYGYELWCLIDGGLKVGRQKRVRPRIEGGAAGLTLDNFGNLFYTTSANNGAIYMIPANKILSGEQPRELYTASNQQAVSGPSGIAADNFYLYWGNLNGGSGGAVGKALERPRPGGVAPAAFVASDQRAYGVCLAVDNIFFTGEANSLYGVKLDGSIMTEVSKNFQKPRGCVYDDQSTLYVADSTANAIYSLPGNFETLMQVRHLTKAMSISNPSGVTIFSSYPTPSHILDRADSCAQQQLSTCKVLLMVLSLGVFTALRSERPDELF